MCSNYLFNCKGQSTKRFLNLNTFSCSFTATQSSNSQTTSRSASVQKVMMKTHKNLIFNNKCKDNKDRTGFQDCNKKEGSLRITTKRISTVKEMLSLQQQKYIEMKSVCMRRHSPCLAPCGSYSSPAPKTPVTPPLPGNEQNEHSIDKQPNRSVSGPYLCLVM